MPPVIIHYHIFKNGGTSIDHMLRESFVDRWASFEGENAHDILVSSRLGAFLVANPKICAVSSHLARPPLPSQNCLPIVFLRNPVLRARSVYQFSRRDPSHFDNHIARSTSFAGYVKWALDGGRGGIVIRDYQVVHLSEASHCSSGILDAKAAPKHLQQAKELISSFGIVGIVELFQKSLQQFQNRYGKVWQELRLSPVWLNRTSIMDDDDAGLKAVKSELGPELYDRLLDANRLDLELYQFALGMPSP